MICVNLSKPIYFSKNSYEVDQFKNEDDLDKNLLYEFHIRGNDLEFLEVFRLNASLIVIGQTVFADYALGKGFTLHKLDDLTHSYIVNKLLEKEEEPDGLDLTEHYDFINKTIAIGNVRVPLSDFPSILDSLYAGEEAYESGMYIYTLKEDDMNFYVNGAQLPKIDASLLTYLIEIKACLVDVYSLSINRRSVLYYGNYFIKIEDNEVSNYIDIRESTPKQLLQFLHKESAPIHKPADRVSKPRKKDKLKSKESKINKVKNFLLYLVKKPD